MIITKAVPWKAVKYLSSKKNIPQREGYFSKNLNWFGRLNCGISHIRYVYRFVFTSI